MQAAAQVNQLNQKIQSQDWTRDVNYRDQATGLCPSCGVESGGGKFCQGCGHALAAAQAAQKFCANCGTPLTGARFCGECGTPGALSRPVSTAQYRLLSPAGEKLQDGQGDVEVAGGALVLAPDGESVLRIPFGSIAAVAEPGPFTVRVTLADGDVLELSRQGVMRTQLLAELRDGRGKPRRRPRGRSARPRSSRPRPPPPGAAAGRPTRWTASTRTWPRR